MKLFIDYTVSKKDIENMSDEELSKLYMYADRDKMSISAAYDIYWLCVEEINCRIEKGKMS